MLFSFYCLDKAGHTHVRSENRDAHIVPKTKAIPDQTLESDQMMLRKANANRVPNRLPSQPPGI